MSIDNMKRIERLVKTETGVYGIASADVEIKGMVTQDIRHKFTTYPTLVKINYKSLKRSFINY